MRSPKIPEIPGVHQLTAKKPEPEMEMFQPKRKVTGTRVLAAAVPTTGEC